MDWKIFFVVFTKLMPRKNFFLYCQNFGVDGSFKTLKNLTLLKPIHCDTPLGFADHLQSARERPNCRETPQSERFREIAGDLGPWAAAQGGA